MKKVEVNSSLCNAVPFTDVKIQSSFWDRVLNIHREVTMPTVINRCLESGRVENFKKAGKYLEMGMPDTIPENLAFEGRFYDDSDVYKAVEGAAYTLMQSADCGLEQQLDEIIDIISSAQWPDGYIMTYYTIDPIYKGQRWTDMDRHEMYCGGHLIEAAIAYSKATGKNKLLNVAIGMTEHWMSVFGPGKRHWVEGHQEPELALVKLYELTHNKRYLDFSLWLLSERGLGNYRSAARPYVEDKEELFYKSEYSQDHLPVEKQFCVCGHAVRAMYMYAGMADIAKNTGNKAYRTALERLWDNLVHRNMYITGGIGSSRKNEGFTTDFDLPNNSAYAETCAAIGMVFFNHRMNLLYEDAKYADIIEKELFNGILSGISLSGDRFFYVNPLEVTSRTIESGEHKQRQEWYKTSCCPTNLARFLPCIPEYIYASRQDRIYINQYIGSTCILEINGVRITLTQKTNYPWDGGITITLSTSKKVSLTLCFRIPGWCSDYSYRYEGISDYPITVENGYACMNMVLDGQGILNIDFSMPVMKALMDPRVTEDVGKAAIQRGPVIYAFESVDNPAGLGGILISHNTKFDTIWKSQISGGIVMLRMRTGDTSWLAVPYYSWGNREFGEMKVFIGIEKGSPENLCPE